MTALSKTLKRLIDFFSTVSFWVFLASTLPATAGSHSKPLPGDNAPSIEALTLSGEGISLSKLLESKPLSLVFIDALCPMPHFPGCEAKIASLNALVSEDNSRHWLAVINSYYVDETWARTFVKNLELKLPIIFDSGNSINRAYGIFASPYQIDINRQGKIFRRGELIH